MSENKDIVDISFEPVHDDVDSTNAEIKEVKKKTEGKKGNKKKQSEKKLLSKIADQEKVLKAIMGERDDYKDKFLRNLAEIDNFRKRMKKEKDDFKKYILGDFLSSLLDVVDNIERALKSRADNTEDKSIITGVEMIYKQLMELLRKNNVVEIDAMGQAFDPNLHQALSKEEMPDVLEPTVIEVYQKGFIYNEKLLRPALTKVAIPVEVEDTVIERG
jgi:molecular chaperone GrpE